MIDMNSGVAGVSGSDANCLQKSAAEQMPPRKSATTNDFHAQNVIVSSGGSNPTLRRQVANLMYYIFTYNLTYLFFSYFSLFIYFSFIIFFSLCLVLCNSNYIQFYSN